MAAFLNPFNRIGYYVYQLVHNTFAEGCRYDDIDQITKFIGIFATMDWSATPCLHRDKIAT